MDSVDRGPNWPNVAAQFKPGGPGGPGRKPYKKITEVINEVLASNTLDGEPIPHGKTVAAVLAEVFVREAKNGKFAFAKEILDRTEGKVPDKVQHSGIDDGIDAEDLRALLLDVVGEDREAKARMARGLLRLARRGAIVATNGHANGVHDMTGDSNGDGEDAGATDGDGG